MRINEILIESQLEEGPLLNKIGSGIGKAAGSVAKGVGAVAGGVAGLGSALKKGFQAGKQTVAGAGDATAAPAGTAPAAQANTATAAPAGTAPAAPTTAADINAQGPKGTAAAKTQTGAGAQALQKTAQAAGGDTEKAGQTLYAQVKSQVNQLDKKGKSRIMQLLQKSLQQTPAAAAPAADPAVAPAANTAAPTPGFNSAAAADPAAPGSDAAKDNLYGAGNRPKGAKDKVAALKAQNATTTAPANTMANAPVSATNTAAADNPNQPPPVKKRGGKVAGQDSQTPDAIRKRNARRDKKNAAATTGGAGAFNQMAQPAAQQNASKNNLGNPLAEALARQIKVHKQKMYEQVSATTSADSFNIFRKK
jgi:hypothetical protein